MIAAMHSSRSLQFCAIRSCVALLTFVLMLLVKLDVFILVHVSSFSQFASSIKKFHHLTRHPCSCIPGSQPSLLFVNCHRRSIFSCYPSEGALPFPADVALDADDRHHSECRYDRNRLRHAAVTVGNRRATRSANQPDTGRFFLRRFPRPGTTTLHIRGHKGQSIIIKLTLVFAPTFRVAPVHVPQPVSTVGATSTIV